MFCPKCGKEIPDQAKFCNHCGNPVNTAQPQAAPAQPSAPTPQAAPKPQAAPAPQSAPAKKKGAGRTLLTIIIAVIVFFAARYIGANVVGNQNRESNFEKGFNAALEADPDVTMAMSSCYYGGLYENGSLRYGMTKLNAPGYSLLAGEGDEADWLISSDNACLLGAYKQFEGGDISYNISDEESLLKSIRQTYSDATMVDYQKYYVNDFPVIRYITACTVEGMYQYQGELVVFPTETTDETIRLAMFADASSGYTDSDINQVFDTLEVSPEFRVKSEETQVMGLNRIVVK